MLASFLISVVKDVFQRCGIFPINEYGDGNIMWGNEPVSQPYTGDFQITDEFVPGRIDIHSIRSVLVKLDRAGHMPIVEEELFKRINEGLE